MKVLLALSLLLFLDSVFSLGDIFRCPTFGKCPDGYTKNYSGPSMLKAVCLCIKNPPKPSPCSEAIFFCKLESGRNCPDMESDCPISEIINACNNGSLPFFNICDRTNQRLRKEKYAKTQRQCEFSRDQCRLRTSYHCYNAQTLCDPDTTVQLCKDKRIPLNFICERAEIEKEKERAEDTKYSCDQVQRLCPKSNLFNYCSNIAKLCDVETAAKWCYKDDKKEMKKISDEDCSKAIKKSQYLTFGRTSDECWRQLPLCEGGNFEACMQVPTLCGKEAVSALCNAKKITNRRICTYAGLEEATSSSYPGCNFFADKCNKYEDKYCQLASRYCDNNTINALCSMYRIEDESICKRAQVGSSVSFVAPIIGTIQSPGGFGFGF